RPPRIGNGRPVFRHRHRRALDPGAAGKQPRVRLLLYRHQMLGAESGGNRVVGLADVNRPRAREIGVAHHERALHRVLRQEIARRPVWKRTQLGALPGCAPITRWGPTDAGLRMWAPIRWTRVRAEPRDLIGEMPLDRLRGVGSGVTTGGVPPMSYDLRQRVR